MVELGLKKILEKKSFDNFVEAFMYLMDAGYEEVPAFFNAIELYDKLIPDCICVCSAKHVDVRENAYLFVNGKGTSPEFVNFIKFCIKEGFDLEEFISDSPILIINDNRLNLFFRKLFVERGCGKKAPLKFYERGDCGRDALCKILFNEYGPESDPYDLPF